MERKLTTILAADVVGFSTLMEGDEESTLQTLRGHLEAAQTMIVEHGGRVFGGAGDSLVAEFSSAVEAVECALRVQDEIAQRNAGLPEVRRMQLRIGVNVGDVMVAEDGLYGDGVNVADRLQASAPAGGVYISESTYHHVHKRVVADYLDLGPRQIKNIAERVRMYHVRPSGGGGPTQRWPRRRAVVAGIAAGVAIAVALGFNFWPSRWAPPNDVEEAAGPPGEVRPMGHFRVDQPAELADAEALTIYERIREAMVTAYARSGLDIAQDYRTWRRYNTSPYLSSTHGARFVNNYANDAAIAYGRFEGAAEMPAGAVLAKDSFEVTQRGDVLTGPLFLMEKMPEGFRADTRDWRYTMIMPDGQLFGRTGGEHSARMEFCVECHRAAGAEHDHMFFLPEAYRRRFLQLDDDGG